MINYLVDCHNPSYFLYFHAVNENAQLARGGMPLPILSDKIVINHYQLKSKEEYLNKCKRGNAINFKSALIYNEERFLASDHNEVFDDGILKYREERAKVYQPPDKSHSEEKLLSALERNLSPTLSANTPLEFYAGKMETFLTCRAVSSYLQTKLSDDTQAKFYEETSLKAILKSLAKMSLTDAQLLIRELPNLVNLPYSVAQEFRHELFERIPLIIAEVRSRCHLREFVELYYLEDFLLALVKPKESD